MAIVDDDVVVVVRSSSILEERKEGRFLVVMSCAVDLWYEEDEGATLEDVQPNSAGKVAVSEE